MKKCPVCSNRINIKFEKISYLCTICNSLINLNVKKHNYTIEGSQNIPDKKKHNLRLENSDSRFKIIERFIKKKNESVLIDIGTGSGEMLIAGKKYFNKVLGFELGSELNDFYRKNNIKVYNTKFNKKIVSSEIQNCDHLFFTLNHVIEHNSDPIDLIKNIFEDFPKAQIYIEVPLYTGLSYKKYKYSWPLWYDQHLALYSLETLKYIAKEINLSILDIGNRVFVSESYMKKRNLMLFLSKPIKFIQTFFEYKKEINKTFMDLFLKDYGYIILKK